MGSHTTGGESLSMRTQSQGVSAQTPKLLPLILRTDTALNRHMKRSTESNRKGRDGIMLGPLSLGGDSEKRRLHGVSGSSHIVGTQPALRHSSKPGQGWQWPRGELSQYFECPWTKCSNQKMQGD